MYAWLTDFIKSMSSLHSFETSEGELVCIFCSSCSLSKESVCNVLAGRRMCNVPVLAGCCADSLHLSVSTSWGSSISTATSRSSRTSWRRPTPRSVTLCVCQPNVSHRSVTATCYSIYLSCHSSVINIRVDHSI